MATRRESVVLELDDRFSPGMLKAAAAAALVQRELDKLDGTSTRTGKSMSSAEGSVVKFDRTTRDATPTIDKLSGRLSLLGHTAAAIGPAFVPIGAVAIPVVADLASGLGFAAIGAGTTALAFHGLSDALTKFNKAAAEPTTANIAAAKTAMDKIPPSAEAFVLELHRLTPELSQLRQVAGAGLFAGLDEGLRSASTDLPLAKRLIGDVSTELGALGREAGDSLASSRWRPFLSFLDREAPRALDDLGHAAGSATHGVAELWMAFAPANRNVGAGILRLAQDFDQWATALGKTKDFQSFLDYVNANGPKVIELLGSVASVFIDIARAAAPLGGPTLDALNLIVRALDVIAKMPLATPLLALVQVNSILKLTSRGMQGLGVDATIGLGGISRNAATAKAELTGLRAEAQSAGVALRTLGGNIGKNAANGTPLLAGVDREGLANLGKGIALAGGLAIASSGASDAMGLQNTTMLATAGLLAGPWGAAVGGAIGAGLDWKAALDQQALAVSNLHSQVSQLAAVGDLAGLQRLANGARQVGSFAASQGGIFSGLQSQASIPTTAFSTTKGAISQFNTSLTGSTDPVTKLAQLRSVATRMQPAMAKLGITFDDMLNMDPSKLSSTVDRLARMTLRGDAAQGTARAVAAALGQMSNQALSADDRIKGLTDALDGLFGPKLNLNATRNSYLESLRGLKSALSNPGDAKAAQVAVHAAEITLRNAVKAHGKNSAEARVAAERLQIAQKNLAAATAATSKAILGTSDAALKNQDAIRGIVSQMLAYIDAQVQAGRPAREIVATYKQQRAALVDTATQLGINKHDLEVYLRTLGFTPKAIATEIHLNGLDPAEAALKRLTRRRFVYVDIITPQGHVDTIATGGHTLTGYAGGGTVPGSRHPYRDGVLALLAGTEEVISNRHGEADRFRRDRAMGAIPAYADGGMVAARNAYANRYMSTSSGSGGEGIDYDRLARAMLNARPLYGPVQMQPHNYSEFVRQMEQDRAMAAMSGVRR